MAIYFAPVGSGIGDVVVCKPAGEWLARNCPDPVFFVARGPRQVSLSRLIDGLAGEITELELKEKLSESDRLVNLRDHHLQRHHDWFAPDFKRRFPNFHIVQILDEICRDFGIEADHSEIKPFVYSQDERARDAVILVPGTTMKSKSLKTSFWLSLHAQLAKQGRKCLMLGSLEHSRQTKELASAGISHLPTENLQEAIDLISNASSLVSVDTGLMHIGVQQGVNTVCIYGVCETYHRATPNSRPIFTDVLNLSLVPPPEYPRYDFPAIYDNWNYLPASAEDGDYIAFDDVQAVLDLLVAVVNS